MTDALPNDISITLRQVNDLLQSDANEEAAKLAGNARRLFPVSSELIRLHGVALMRLGRRRDAQQALIRAAELAPSNIELQCNLAALSLADGKPGPAIDRLQKALTASPGHPIALQTLGSAYMATGQFDRARNALALAAKTVPNQPTILLNLAAAELELGNLPEAEKQVRAALQHAPTSDAAHAMLGHMMHMQNRPHEAAAALLRAGKLAPKNPQHMFRAALMLNEAGDLSAANAAFADSLARGPHSVPTMGQLLLARRRLCRWKGIDGLSERVKRAVEQGERGVHPFAFQAEETSAAQQLRCATTHAEMVDEQIAAFRKQLNLRYPLPLPDAPVRIGMLSDGFHERAVGHHIVALIEALADSDLDIHLFATTPDDGSAVRRRLSAAATLHDISKLNRKQFVELIHGSAIEILFDLNGYHGRGNSELMAMRAAPVQVNWLGYMGSSGASWTDYLMTDAVVLPAELRSHFSEKIIRLPRCAQPNDPTRVDTKVPSRAECGLPEQGIVFASFCETYSMGPAVFARSMLILQQVADSVLWLISGPADSDDRLRHAAKALDVAPERLVFMPHLPYDDYCARYAHVDLFLDTLPISSRGPASNALWAGCPVLTRTGETMAGRTVASMLHHLGLPELITADVTSFIGMASALGNDPDALSAIKRHLLEQRSKNTLFDMQGFASDFRRAVLAISARHRIGRPPTDMDV